MVLRARRCSRTPRSSPAKASSRKPNSVTSAIPGSLCVEVDPPEERQPEPAVIDAERPRREDRVDELAAAMEEAGGVATRGPVVEIELHLLEGEARPERVDRHPHLGAEARRQREAGLPRPRPEEALARERLARRGARPQAHELAPDALCDPEASAHATAERGDCEIGLALGERAQRAAEVRVGQEQWPRRRGALAGGERLALSEPLDAKHDRSSRLGALRGPILRAPVDDDHVGVREVATEGGDGLADPLLLVPSGNDDRQALGPRGAIHPRPRGARSAE